ncbi:FecR family protein [Sphingobacterium sp. DR205]|uniref:FecR family protein n=1 Tax=Sphingobacterium sp. DR205 TaxID=2713573 RepID=UPI0013E45A8E|nr:FecR family protein [Sphingobacterium sp. DR205]QIH35959.1 DUF4974 domain-containing protein [Sphingobacterium sp. DR205]
MLKNEFHISQLIVAHLRGTITEAEQLKLDEWLSESPMRARLMDELREESHFNKELMFFDEVDKDAIWTKLTKKLIQDETSKVSSIKKYWKALAAASIILAVFAAGMLYYNNFSTDRTLSAISNNNEVNPGKIGATLTLANGERIKLSDAANGQISEDAGVRISKSANGQLEYEVEENKHVSSGYNVLSTAKGETYKVLLPDGTQVWLNAASSIRYPTNFSSHSTRKVLLEGEAYFEVASDTSRPFIVKTNMQETKVLGTHFNINSYSDEPNVLTTLLKGSISVYGDNKVKILKPGQQANLSKSGNLQVRRVDTEPIISWTKNEFMFDGDNIDAVMRKIARWYNVEIVYQGVRTTDKFNGTVSRFSEVHEVLQLLEKTGTVKFRVDGKTIYIL